MYTYILDSLRGFLTQKLNKTAKFNQGRPRRNYRAQTRPSKVTFTSSPSLRLSTSMIKAEILPKTPGVVVEFSDDAEGVEISIYW